MTRNILIVIILLSLIACKQPPVKTVGYIYSIDSLRSSKNLLFQDPASSPLTEQQRLSFNGLNYFPIDSNYRVEASLSVYETMDTFEMPTSTDRLPKYIRYGMLSFRVNDKGAALEVYKNVEAMKKPGHENDIFIPFKDLTCGTESYGGGRFLDMEAEGPGMLTLDFNRAYNPYCAYNPNWSCPLPPPINSLNLEIRAGEKAFEH